MTDKPDVSAQATSTYLYNELSKAIGTIAMQTGQIAELQAQLTEAQMPTESSNEFELMKKKPSKKNPKPVGQSAKQSTGKVTSRTGPR